MKRQERETGKGLGGATANGVLDAVLRQARKSGQLNLSSRALGTVPSAVWRLNVDPPSQDSASGSFGSDDNDRWWEQTELVKLILAGNGLTVLSEDIRLLPALTVLDVSKRPVLSVVWCVLCTCTLILVTCVRCVHI